MICSVERFVSIIVAAITGPLNPLPAKKYPVAVSVLSVPLALYQAIANTATKNIAKLKNMNINSPPTLFCGNSII